jgi:hypothetical protein
MLWPLIITADQGRTLLQLLAVVRFWIEVVVWIQNVLVWLMFLTGLNTMVRY